MNNKKTPVTKSGGGLQARAIARSINGVGYGDAIADVAYGIASDIYKGKSKNETVNNAIVNATFATAGLVIGGVAFAILSPIIGVTAAVAAGFVVGVAFNYGVTLTNGKTKYKRRLGLAY